MYEHYIGLDWAQENMAIARMTNQRDKVATFEGVACERTLEYLKKLPQVTALLLADKLGMSTPTARSSLNHMVELRILEEVSGKKRDKVYVYRKYLHILKEGAESFNFSP